jgi:uncharacterized protein YxjI
MRFYISERFWSLTEDFVIRDEQGQPVLQVHSPMLHLGGDELRVMDMAGNELARIEQKLLAFRPRYRIYSGGALRAEIHEQFKLFGERFRVDGDGYSYEVDGDIWNHNYRVFDPSGNTVAAIHKDFIPFRESYAIDIAQGADVPVLLALVLVLDRVADHERERR